MLRRRCLPLVAVLALCAACGRPSSEADQGGLQLAAGDSLFAHLAAMRVLDAPRTALPADAAERLRAALGADFTARPRERVHEHAAQAWQAADQAHAEAVRRRLGVTFDAHAWRLHPSVDLGLPLGRVRLEHDGRTLRPLRRDESTGHRRWADDERLALFSWEPELGELLCVASEPPAALRVSFDASPEPDLFTWERRLGEQPPPADARALLRRVTLDRLHASALAVAAPTRLELRVDRLLADTLELRVAAPPVGAQVVDGALRSAPALSDGVEFALELLPDGAREPVRVWARRVSPGRRWHTAQVDLRAYRGTAFTLALVTDDASAERRVGDYALWSGLRLRGGKRRAPERPHLVLVDLDTLRADRLGMYGSARDTSPRLDAWAAREAVVFEQARAASDWTLPSTASMLTGLSVPQHGVTRLGERVQAAHGSLALRLAAAGYETWAHTDGGVVVPENGFAAGFDRFDHATDVAQLGEGLHALLGTVRARRSERPLFLFVQTYAVHTPYAQDRRFVDGPVPAGRLGSEAIHDALVAEVVAERGAPLSVDEQRYVSALYDAGVARMDPLVADFLEGLDDAFDGEPYAVVLTSDHGEELFERGDLGHGNSLHRELLHVPLVLRLPDGPRGVRRDDAADALDLVPTLLAQAGLPIPTELPGRDLARPPSGEALHVAQHRDAAWSIEWNDAKLLTGPIGRDDSTARTRAASGVPLPSDFPSTLALFDLGADPHERVDRADEDPARTAALLERLELWRAEHAPVLGSDAEAPPLSAAQIEQLGQLGYVEDG